VDCADLLYVYKQYVVKEFVGEVAGEKALLIPRIGLIGKERQRFIAKLKEYMTAIGKGVEQREENLLDIIINAPDYMEVTSLTLIWAEQIDGQYLKDFKGIITDILPTRLYALSKINREFNRKQHLLFPKHELLSYNLAMDVIGKILKRPGGKKTASLNESLRLFQLKRSLLGALYRNQALPVMHFWNEVFVTARCYLNGNLSAKEWIKHLQYETKSEYKKHMTLASWLRHLAKLLYYFQTTEVFPMPEQNWYEPKLDKLKPYFGPESGINSREKAFAFLLGVVYGKLLAVQGARKVNVASNALTWLKRLTLSGRDLPEFYTKVRGKLLVYGTERSDEVRELLNEVAQLGAKLGDQINLSETQTCYYLLLGQSLAQEILPSKDAEDEQTNS
jgi:CRISPR-associated protein Csh1